MVLLMYRLHNLCVYIVCSLIIMLFPTVCQFLSVLVLINLRTRQVHVRVLQNTTTRTLTQLNK